MADFKNILVVRTDRIGDVVLTVPAVRALKAAFPKARVTMWTAAATRDLVAGLPFVNEVLVEDTSRGWRGYFEFVSLLMGKEFDLVVNFHTKRRTNAACFLAMIPFRLGYKNDKFGFLLSRPVEDRRYLGEKHEAEYCLDLLKEIGVASSDLRLELAFQREAEAWADRFFLERKLTGKTVVALHPDASGPTKCWPAGSFGELGERLANAIPAEVVIVGGATAKPSALRIGEQMKHDYHDLTGFLSLAQLASLLRRCHILISNDSGPVHVAAAVGTPVVSLFLRSQPGINPGRWRPLGERSAILLNKPGEEIMLDREGQVDSGKFDSISVQEVFQKARELLNLHLPEKGGDS